MAQEALIHLENIIKRYPGAVALNGVSMDFFPGHIHAVIGENGAGKTTLMRMIDGLCVPDGGRIVVDGQPMESWNTALARRHGIAMVHQHFTLIPEMTVVENVLLAGGSLLPVRLGRAEAAGRIRQLCAAYGFDLDPLARAGSLSPGQKQRAEIIKALYYQCRLLILDEPTAVLTGGEVSRLFEVLRKLAAEGTAVVLISHKLDEVMEVCDVITVLRRGVVVGSCRAGEMTAAQVAALMTAQDEASERTRGMAVRGAVPEKKGRMAVREAPPEVGAAEATQAAATLAVAATTEAEVLFATPEVSEAASEKSSAVAVPPALEIRNLYLPGNGGGGRDSRPDLDGISLSLFKGEIYGIAGVDGNGQSGLTAALMGLAPRLGRGDLNNGLCRQGVIFLNGADVTSATPGQMLARGVAYIPEDCQETGIVRAMTVEENLILNSFRKEKYGRRFWMNWGAVRREAVRAMGALDIRAYSGKQPVGTLSGGNQQKLVVARELGKKPELIIASNPTRGIDGNGAQKIRSEFLKASHGGCAILLISADLDEILYLADRIGVMCGGKIIAEYPGVKANANSEENLREQIGLAMAGIRESV